MGSLRSSRSALLPTFVDRPEGCIFPAPDTDEHSLRSCGPRRRHGGDGCALGVGSGISGNRGCAGGVSRSQSAETGSDPCTRYGRNLCGSVGMPAVVIELLREQDRRRAAGDVHWRLAFRPDHGHVMMDDLEKTISITTGYSCIGRMRGLAEPRGLMLGLRHGRNEGRAS